MNNVATLPESNVSVISRTIHAFVELLKPAHWSASDFVEFLKASTPVVTLGVLAFGIYQYRVAQNWKRTEFAAALLRELNADEDLIAACSILDYPERCVVLSHIKTEDEKPVVVKHTRELLQYSMLVPVPRVANVQVLAYRDIFDRLFSYMTQVEHFCSRKLISREDVEPLRYWLNLILYPRRIKDEADHDRPPPEIFREFVLKYHPSVVKLCERFDRPTSWFGSSSLTRYASANLKTWVVEQKKMQRSTTTRSRFWRSIGRAFKFVKPVKAVKEP